MSPRVSVRRFTPRWHENYSAGSGGRPAVVQSSSAHAATWVEDRRRQTTEASTRPGPRSQPVVIRPTCRRKTRSTPTSPCRWVPDSRPRAQGASISQDQPTLARSGSVTISGSTSARAKLTRKVPCQAALPAGSCSRTRRPLPISASLTTTSAAMAAAKGDPLRCWNFLHDQLRSPARGQQLMGGAPEDVEAGAAWNSLPPDERGGGPSRSSRRADLWCSSRVTGFPGDRLGLLLPGRVLAEPAR